MTRGAIIEDQPPSLALATQTDIEFGPANDSEPALRNPNPSPPAQMPTFGARRLRDAATPLSDWGVAVVNTNTSAIRIQKAPPPASLDSACRRVVVSNCLDWTVRCQGRGRPLEPCELEAY